MKRRNTIQRDAMRYKDEHKHHRFPRVSASDEEPPWRLPHNNTRNQSAAVTALPRRVDEVHALG